MLHVCVCMCMYIYIYRERERKRDIVLLSCCHIVNSYYVLQYCIIAYCIISNICICKSVYRPVFYHVISYRKSRVGSEAMPLPAER